MLFIFLFKSMVKPSLPLIKSMRSWSCRTKHDILWGN